MPPDEHLLRQPDYNSRQGQAIRGHARLSLAPAAEHPMTTDSRVYDDGSRPLYADETTASQLYGDVSRRWETRYEPPPSQRLDLSRFALDSPRQELSSSTANPPLSSSPTLRASQRRPAAVRYGNDREDVLRRPGVQVYETEHPSAYSSVDAHVDTGLEDPSAFEEKPERQSQLEDAELFVRQESIPMAKHGVSRPPVVQGITLVSTRDLPDRFRALFSFPLFNAVQSKCFDTVFRTNDNFVLSSPTGSGKTAVFELAICRLINGFATGSYKIIYQAPTKSLCSERYRDWQHKFGPLDLQCAELTGDTDGGQLRNVQHATIIITTPEKWDSMTRKWKDQQKLMQMVKLFLIDEVHILKEDRGATLEAVVSRMKSVGSDVRFLAISATVPNQHDVAVWLGRDHVRPHEPARREKFGEEFRPVRLQKHVCGYPSTTNDFAFDKTLNGKLPDVVARYSKRKPIMVFCFTRSSCVETAKVLSNWWATKGPRDRYWSPPRGRVVVADKDLRGLHRCAPQQFTYRLLTHLDRHCLFGRGVSPRRPRDPGPQRRRKRLSRGRNQRHLLHVDAGGRRQPAVSYGHCQEHRHVPRRRRGRVQGVFGSGDYADAGAARGGRSLMTVPWQSLWRGRIVSRITRR